ncbi:hypothetical protein Har1130_04650 [Haloarcula sp. CBA1130]|uniref:phosphotransferase n=1 Tax=unclassified Haloarcula TaxID=2624677 RepID=UPI001245BD68|nr:MULTISPECIES: phosphotransferase [unclassified Haloarcula]KAA9398343.1 hypothetical protein Har1129_09010 [Haloarcula sp. CBA1129]KAA9402062.1 hypothetical protein Har1130_04650 [Haloarcula sp. CBA1130]
MNDTIKGCSVSVRDSAWLTLFRNQIRGTALCVGSQRVSDPIIVGHLADEVYVVDNSCDRLQCVRTAAQHEGASVQTLLGNTDSLPFRGEFDSIICDYSYAAEGHTISTRPSDLAATLTESGVLLVVTDTPAGVLRSVAKQPIKRFTNFESLFQNAVRHSVSHIRAQLADCDFETVVCYCLFPDSDSPNYLFPVSETRSVFEFFTQQEFTTNYRKIRRLPLGERILEKTLPTVLFACYKDGAKATGITDDLIIKGHHRAVALSLDDGVVQSVSKYPFGERYSQSNIREHSIVSHIRNLRTDFSAVPLTSSEDTALGTAVVQEPATGGAMSHQISDDDDAPLFTAGIEWLIKLHTATQSAKFVDESLQLDRDTVAFDIDLPDAEPIATAKTAVHGDYAPKNIFVQDESVTSVVDWEYGAISGNCIIDLAMFVFEFASARYGSFRRGFEAALLRDTPFSNLVRDQIKRYCEEIGIDTRAFKRYAISPYVNLIRVNDDIGGFTRTVDVDRYLKKIEIITSDYDSILV